MEADFPAAHSMDTSWFAVDRDGHVAYFSSGEAGAVPTPACAYDRAAQAELRLTEVAAAGPTVHDLAGRLMPGKLGRHPQRAWSHEYPVLAFLSAVTPARAFLDDGRGAQLDATDGVAVLLRGLTKEELDALHADPQCRATFNQFGFEGGEPNSLASRGVYVYGHLTDNWISGPYGREELPAQPVHIDQLPPDLRRLLGAMRFDGLSFADTPHLQPVEHTQCESWETAYIDASGQRIRPIPGKEAEYADVFDEYYSDTGLEADPPAE